MWRTHGQRPCVCCRSRSGGRHTRRARSSCALHDVRKENTESIRVRVCTDVHASLAQRSEPLHRVRLRACAPRRWSDRACHRAWASNGRTNGRDNGSLFDERRIGADGGQGQGQLQGSTRDRTLRKNFFSSVTSNEVVRFDNQLMRDSLRKFLLIVRVAIVTGERKRGCAASRSSAGPHLQDLVGASPV